MWREPASALPAVVGVYATLETAEQEAERLNNPPDGYRVHRHEVREEPLR